MLKEKYLENDFFGQGKHRELRGWPGRFSEDLKSQEI